MGILFNKGAKSALPWDEAAEEALSKAPMVLRSMIRSKVEKQVLANGGGRVSLDDFRRAEEGFRGVASDKSLAQLKKNLPSPNEPGVPMVIISSCHNRLAGCRFPLIDTEEWRREVEKWVKRSDASERLRRRIQSDVILMHNKLKVSISGCPNGCSRPQIADFGIVGFARPEFDQELCTGCGECSMICPDRALSMEGDHPSLDADKCQGCRNCFEACPARCISLTRVGARLTVGGKLGRHPHLGERAGVFARPGELTGEMDRVLNLYLKHGHANERLADFLIRRKESEI